MDGQLDLLGASTPVTRTTPDIATYAAPAARRTDPSTSHAAAQETKPGADALRNAIRAYLAEHGPSTAWQIADAIAGDRWDHSTVRSACAPARSGCIELDGGVRVVRGKRRPVKRYALKSGAPRANRMEQETA